MVLFVVLLMFIWGTAHVVIGNLKIFHVLMRVRLYIVKIYAPLISSHVIIPNNFFLPLMRMMSSQFLMKVTGSFQLILLLLSILFKNVKPGVRKRRDFERSMKDCTRIIIVVANVDRLIITKRIFKFSLFSFYLFLDYFSIWMLCKYPDLARYYVF